MKNNLGVIIRSILLMYAKVELNPYIWLQRKERKREFAIKLKRREVIVGSWEKPNNWATT